MGPDNSVLAGSQGNSQNEHLTPIKGAKDSSGIRGQHGHHHMLPNTNLHGNMGGPASVYQGKLQGHGSKHHRGNSVDALNSSVEMRGKIHMLGNK